jgi:hypothetical protein
MKQAASRALIAGYFFVLFLNPEDGGSIFLRKVRELVQNYMVSIPENSAPKSEIFSPLLV